MYVLNPYSFAVAATAAWYDAATQAQSDGTIVMAADTWRWSTVTLPAGNVTKLRLYVGAWTSNSAIKLGIHNSSGTLLGEVSLTATSTGTWEATLGSPIGISAGDYEIGGLNLQAGNASFGRWSAAPSARRDNGNCTSNVVPDPLPTSNFNTAQNLCVGAYVA